jgi:DNA helicase II / ATP-dependent DNA helicase PcrA
LGGGAAPWGSATKSGAAGARSDWASSVFSSKNGAAERFANPAVPPQREAPAHGLKAGTNVFHAKFGEGRVQMLEGSGDDARAQINFTRHGVKWLALSVAKLTVVS